MHVDIHCCNMVTVRHIKPYQVGIILYFCFMSRDYDLWPKTWVWFESQWSERVDKWGLINDNPDKAILWCCSQFTTKNENGKRHPHIYIYIYIYSWKLKRRERREEKRREEKKRKWQVIWDISLDSFASW